MGFLKIFGFPFQRKDQLGLMESYAMDLQKALFLETPKGKLEI
jgi:hypothetical protein